MHIHRVSPRTVLAVTVIISAIVGAIAPAAAQKDVTPATVGRVRATMSTTGLPGGPSGPASTFVKYSEKAWAEVRDAGGTNSDLLEDKQDATSVTLVQGPRPQAGIPTGPRYVIDLVKRTITGALISKSDGGYVALPIYGTITDVSADTCKSRTLSPANCVCDLRWLRPLQGAVGLGEVADKAKKIRDPQKLAKERADLEQDPIKVVLGFGGDYYVVEHHHGARAWLEAGYTAGVCKIQDSIGATDPDSFWAQLKARKWVYLKDKDGVVITPDKLPKRLEEMPDDPYRTLAWMVRKRDGFCRSLMTGETAFAEFQWADWMRGQQDKLPLASVKAATDKSLWDRSKKDREAAQKRVLDDAVALAISPGAQGLPGYRANRANITNCNSSGDD